MRRNALFVTAGLLVAIFAFGAIACGSSKKKESATATPPATATGRATEASRQTTPSATALPAATVEGAQTPAATVEGAQTSAATVEVAQNAQLGTILTDGQGNTLYRFKNDQPGVSNCNAGCVGLWPPLTTTGTPTAGVGVTGDVGVIERADGTRQVTYNSRPLYRFANDTAPGDTKGDRFADLWSVVKVE